MHNNVNKTNWVSKKTVKERHATGTNALPVFLTLIIQIFREYVKKKQLLCQGDLVLGFDFDFRLHKLTFSHGRSRATRNTQAKTLAPTEEKIVPYKVNM